MCKLSIRFYRLLYLVTILAMFIPQKVIIVQYKNIKIYPVSAISFITIYGGRKEKEIIVWEDDDFIESRWHTTIAILLFWIGVVRSCFLSLSCRTSCHHKTEISNDRELAYVYSSLRSVADSHVSGTGLPRSSFQVYNIQNARVRRWTSAIEWTYSGQCTTAMRNNGRETRKARKEIADGLHAHALSIFSLFFFFRFLSNSTHPLISGKYSIIIRVECCMYEPQYTQAECIVCVK